MIYLEVSSLEAWAKEKGVIINILRCRGCDKEFATTIPFVTRQCYGLDMPPHGCPQKMHRVSEISRNPEIAKNRMLDLFEYCGVSWYDARKWSPPVEREADNFIGLI